MEIFDIILNEMNRKFDAFNDIDSKIDFLSGSWINKTNLKYLLNRAK